MKKCLKLLQFREMELVMKCFPKAFGYCRLWLKNGIFVYRLDILNGPVAIIILNTADDWFNQLTQLDAIYFGAVGWPETVPDHISLWGSLLKFRRDFQQYVNLRPVRLLPGVPCPLANKKPEDIDF